MVEWAEAHPQGLSSQLCLFSFVACHPLCFFTCLSYLLLSSVLFSQVIYSKERKQTHTQSSQPLCLRPGDNLSVRWVCELDRWMVKSRSGRNIQIQTRPSKNTPLLQHSNTKSLAFKSMSSKTTEVISVFIMQCPLLDCVLDLFHNIILKL